MTDKPRYLSVVGQAFRSLPVAFRGKARIARLALGRQIQARDVRVVTRDGFRVTVPCVADSIGFHLFTDGVYEPAELAWMSSQLAEDDVYVDVGANIGAFVLPLSQVVGARGRVLAIEASATTAAYLRQNVSENHVRNVTIVEEAAADSNGTRSFYQAPSDQFGGSSLGPSPGYAATEVRTRTLDEMLEEAGVSHVRLLKVDVEGFEAGVLRGAQRLLNRPDPPVILFEFYDWAESRAGEPGDAQRVLLSAGYSIWRFEDYVRGAGPLTNCVTKGFGGNMVAARR